MVERPTSPVPPLITARTGARDASTFLSMCRVYAGLQYQADVCDGLFLCTGGLGTGSKRVWVLTGRFVNNWRNGGNN
ncbi:hypothetical protein Hdeb2414_s0013g00412331 [Helianthus debilis subsp. tardiflorus]